MVMYYLRGSVVDSQPRESRPPDRKRAAGDKEQEYLAAWKRTSDALEHSMDEIHAIAATGQSIIEPMRTSKKYHFLG